MTVLRLREYRSVEWAMSTEAAQAVADAAGSGLQVTQTFESGRWQITSGSHVGTVVAGDVRILVTPKVKAANLFHMLEAGGDPVPVQSGIFEYERTGDLLPAFATFFAAVLDEVGLQLVLPAADDARDFDFEHFGVVVKARSGRHAGDEVADQGKGGSGK